MPKELSDTGIALYRKYRPRTFKDVIGQDHVVKVLLGALELGTISHAYLFSGSRGTGKTSIARIFAREIGTTENDLYEIDAASNTSVDDVRALNESVNTLPFESKYKVYILDEVHMLSKSAFNALLKTLEEPPKHVIFILATTEMEKLPETIISRCQTFTFKKPNQKILRETTIHVAKDEGFTVEPDAAELIALLGDGSFRDTLGILQKVITASKDKKVSAEEVEIVTGAPKGELVWECVAALSEKNLPKGLKTIKNASDGNIDMRTLITLMLHKIRTILLLKYSPDLENHFKEEFGDDEFQKLKSVSGDKNSHINSATVVELIHAYDITGRSAVAELPLELAFVKLVGQNS